MFTRSYSVHCFSIMIRGLTRGPNSPCITCYNLGLSSPIVLNYRLCHAELQAPVLLNHRLCHPEYTAVTPCTAEPIVAVPATVLGPQHTLITKHILDTRFFFRLACLHRSELGKPLLR